MSESQPSDDKRMRLRYAGRCRLCGHGIDAGVMAIYERGSRTVRCLDCHPVAGAAPLSAASSSPAAPATTAGPTPTAMASRGADVAGASARREFERRHAAREARVRERFPRAGGLLLAMFSDPQHIKAWDTGAIGEEKLGASLGTFLHGDAVALHDRRMPRSRANIDHILVTTAGVWVVDAKLYKGRPDLRVEGGILRPRTEILTVAGRDRSGLVDGVLKQVAAVRDVVPEPVRIKGTLCFIEADWPLLNPFFTTRGVDVVSPRKLRSMIQKAPDAGVDVNAVAERLRRAFPQA